jgi:hypothetical protein
MNTNDSSQNAKKPAQNQEKKPSEAIPPQAEPPKTEPLASPTEPTRAYPADPTRTFSSDPSQYAYPPNKPSSEEPSKVYTTESLDTARLASEERRSAESQAQREKEKETFEDKKEKTAETSNMKGDFYNYMASNREQTITYVLLILGLILILFANGLLGGLIIGMVAGYYFAPEIIYYIRNLGQIIGGRDQLRYIVLAALALGLFIAAPGIFIGAIIVATFKQVMAGPQG